MKLYNTLTKQIEDFIPNEKTKVKMYTCGPTVYNYAHIGNLRTYIFEDVLEKALIYLGYDVKRVMNITDVGHMESDADDGEDKMLKGAKREGKSVLEIAAFYTKSFFQDLEKLNINKPQIVEKASDHIDKYIEMIKKLENDGYAYISNGNVYFDATKALNYYQLSGMNEKDLIIGAREDVCEDENKRNPFDFGLWFTNSKFNNQILQWDSPWGRGYPGWHIECSGIALKYLGNKIDIHCGGVDNIFPHHTNEIAQSEAYTGEKWCNYWLHGEHLNISNGKMSKSKGKFLTLEVLEKDGIRPLAYRFFVLQSHYRNQLVFSDESVKIANIAYTKLKKKINSLTIDKDDILQEDLINKYRKDFIDSISNDLNTANTITLIFDLLKDKLLNNRSKLFLIEDFEKVLSLNLIEVYNIDCDNDFIATVEQKIEERMVAKRNHNYELADKIRDELKAMRVILNDSKGITTWKRED